MPFEEPGADEVLQRVLDARPADRRHRSRRHRRGRRGRGRGRHAGRRAPQPRPAARCRGRSSECADAPARRPARSCCAAPSTRASPRWSSGCSTELGLDVDVAFCPERIAEGKAMDGAVRRCRRSSPAAPPRRVERAAELFRRPHRRDRRARARGGRAGQAVHQHLALHQVRRGQPVLHDGQRLRPRLRAHPHGARARLPARRRHARRRASPPGRACSRTRCSWRRSTTTTSRSATPAMMINEGLPLYLVARLEQQLRPRRR